MNPDFYEDYEPEVDDIPEDWEDDTNFYDTAEDTLEFEDFTCENPF